MLPYPLWLWQPLVPAAPACTRTGLWDGGFRAVGGPRNCLELTQCSADPTHLLLLQALWDGTGPMGSPGLDHLPVVWDHLTELGFPLRAGSLLVFILCRMVLEVFVSRCLQVQPGSVKP